VALASAVLFVECRCCRCSHGERFADVSIALTTKVNVKKNIFTVYRNLKGKCDTPKDLVFYWLDSLNKVQFSAENTKRFNFAFSGEILKQRRIFKGQTMFSVKKQSFLFIFY
jgi:hypothetical protein